ncbi:D-ribose pyranase [Virgibacillus sp. MSP4-1]|uniref:D-ribose pyranase n=1 Tax=Virgibacillus sp. MSP4-1 TaxID=2700081 RepID=UPI00039FFBDC|nr:D-ribose pyranase [Virgibacillus sp. MSP4-1]QHS23391.1 D-ribose pyranase [Virgibacillus sp. MSP4-1]
MKKHGILNSDISAILSNLGHTDQIAIADCGLPIPDHVPKIDLALRLGQPTFLDVLHEVLEDMEVEKMIWAKEIKGKNTKLHNQMENQQIPFDYVTHEELKEACKHVKAVIRTGECTPYANVILQSGVIF